MKKFLKTLLCMMLALALVFSFAACNNGKKDDSASQSDEKDVKEKEESPEELAQETVENFMDAFCELDTNEMAKYVVDPQDIEEAFPFDDVREYIKEAAYSEMGSEAQTLSDMIDPIMDRYIDLFLDTISYEITDCSEGDEGYVVKTEYEMIDADAASAALEEALSEDSLNAIVEEVAIEFASNGTITEQSTEEETIERLLDGVTQKLLPIVDEAMNNVGTVTETLELVVVENKGTWLVDTQKSNALENMKIGSSVGINFADEN